MFLLETRIRQTALGFLGGVPGGDLRRPLNLDSQGSRAQELLPCLVGAKLEKRPGGSQVP